MIPLVIEDGESQGDHATCPHPPPAHPPPSLQPPIDDDIHPLLSCPAANRLPCRLARRVVRNPHGVIAQIGGELPQRPVRIVLLHFPDDVECGGDIPDIQGVLKADTPRLAQRLVRHRCPRRPTTCIPQMPAIQDLGRGGDDLCPQSPDPCRPVTEQGLLARSEAADVVDRRRDEGAKRGDALRGCRIPSSGVSAASSGWKDRPHAWQRIRWRVNRTGPKRVSTLRALVPTGRCCGAAQVGQAMGGRNAACACHARARAACWMVSPQVWTALSNSTSDNGRSGKMSGHGIISCIGVFFHVIGASQCAKVWLLFPPRRSTGF